MHVAIAVGALLLGGWALDVPPDEQPAATIAAPTPSAVAPVLPPATRLMDRGGLRTTVSPTPDATDRLRDRTNQNEQTPNGQQPRSQSQGQAGQLPYLPTEPLPPEADSTQGQPTAPTAPVTGRGKAGGLSTATGPIYGPMAPTAPVDRSGSPWSPGYRGSSSAVNQLSSRAQSLGGVSVAAPPATDKAFNGYQTGSGVSPYMNLFRRDSNGTVDNYTSLVRPQLNQQNLNQQFNRDIGGLNRSAIMQQSMLQQMNNTSRAPEGISTPQFYMNSGGYYPGQ